MKSTGKKKAAVVGIAYTPIRKNLDGSIRDVAHMVIREALDDAGLTLDQVDSIYCAPPAMGGLPNFMFACQLPEYLGAPVRNLSMIECGGVTALSNIKYALCDIQTGVARVALVFCLDKRFLDRMAVELDYFMRSSVTSMINIYGSYCGPYGVGAPIPFYALSAQRYMYEYGVSAEEIAEVPVRLRGNAVNNPKAMYSKPINRKDVLASPMISPPIHLLECPAFASGAAAVVIVHPDVVSGLKRHPVWITGVGEYHHPSHFIPQHASITTFESVAKAAEDAFEDADRKRDDVDVAEVYGVFAATELMIYEDLGFFQKGKAAKAVMNGETAIDGRIAMNPSGGRLSMGHPAAATPAIELAEIVSQLRGEAGPRQVKGANVGLIQAEHGMLNGCMVMILEN